MANLPRGVGNPRYNSNFFDEDSYKRLEQAYKLVMKIHEAEQDYLKVDNKYRAEVSAFIVKQKNALNQLKIDYDTMSDDVISQYNYEKRIYDQQIKTVELEKERTKLAEDRVKHTETLRKANAAERRLLQEFQEKQKNYTKEEIKERKKLDNIVKKFGKEAVNLETDSKEYLKQLKKHTKEYEKQYKIVSDIEKKKKSEELKKNAKQNAVYNLLGLNSSDIQQLKDGTYAVVGALNLLTSVVKLFFGNVNKGIDKNFNTTEATLNRIAASNTGSSSRLSWSTGSINSRNISGFTTNKSYTGIKDLDNVVVDQLKADNLQNNISNTEVREAIAKLTSTSGFGLEEAVAKGYQDTVIKYIVPYLDTTSESFENLEMLMPRYF